MGSVPATASPDILGDSERLRLLREACVLDQPRDLAFDRLTDVATRLLRVPVALVTFVDEARQYFSGATGLPADVAKARQTPLSHSICQHVVILDEPLMIADTREVPRTRDNLAVRDLGVIAYCGVPLRGQNGRTLGSFCAIDMKPHEWAEDDVRVLEQLAGAVMSELELRREVRDLAAKRAALEDERAQSAAALRERDAFMAQVGHELRNSMNPATLAVQLLELDDRLPAGLREEVATIRRSLGGGSRLVADLLDAGRVNSGRLNLDRRRLDLAALADEVVEDLDAGTTTRGVELSCEAEPNCPAIDGDSDRLRQVIANLVGNALKFTDDGGKIVVRVGRAYDGGVFLSVTDDGRGIEPAALPSLFDPFVQAGPASLRKQGLGLGLAICRGIAEAHGGSIRASSPGLGMGSTFRVDLPGVADIG